jgi:hypothetical protein
VGIHRCKSTPICEGCRVQFICEKDCGHPRAHSIKGHPCPKTGKCPSCGGSVTCRLLCPHKAAAKHSGHCKACDKDVPF